MCSLFEKAVSLLRALANGFDLKFRDIVYPFNLRMDSAILLHWASGITSLDLDEMSLHHLYDQGLEPFLVAAVKAHYIEFETTNALAAAKVDHLLSKCCPALKELRICSPVLPSFIPQTITALWFELYDYRGGPHESEWDESRAEALLFRLSKLPALEKLSLNLQTQSSCLVSDECMARLDHLSITLLVGCQDADLSWVHDQSCSFLGVNVCVNVPDLTKNSLLVAELEGLNLSHLSLDLATEWRSELQSMWSGLSTGKLNIGMFGPHLAGTEAVPLQFLPRSENTMISLYRCKTQRAFYIKWALLSSQAANVVIMAYGLTLHVLDASMSDIEGMQQPWQLTVWAASSVVGLPASDTTFSDDPAPWQSWRNAAACAAGWSGSTSLDWTAS